MKEPEEENSSAHQLRESFRITADWLLVCLFDVVFFTKAFLPSVPSRSTEGEVMGGGLHRDINTHGNYTLSFKR